MCTAMMMQTQKGNICFGRTMDFSYPLEPELYIVSKEYEWDNLLQTHSFQNQFRYIGIGQNISPIVFADGVNEKGFAAAALYFPGYAQYDDFPVPNSPAPPIAAIELVGYLLGQCSSVAQAEVTLRTIRIVGTTDSVTGTVAPLHWILADKSGRCITVEKTSLGLQITENPIGVLSNSPDFLWHMTNLRSYMNVSPVQKQQQEWPPVTLLPFGQGGGTSELPGGYTPPARFVRTAYQKTHVVPPADQKEAILTCFHLMEGVSIPKGVVMTSRGTSDYTQYTAFMDLSSQEYFYRTYDNSQICSACLSDHCSSVLQSLGRLTRPTSFPRIWQ